MVAANFRRTHSPNQLAWYEGSRPPSNAMTLVMMTAPQTLSWLLLLFINQTHLQELQCTRPLVTPAHLLLSGKRTSQIKNSSASLATSHGHLLSKKVVQ